MPLDFLSNDFIFPCEPETPKLMSGPNVKVPESVDWSFQATQDCVHEYTIVSSGRIPGAFEFQLKTDSTQYHTYSETSSICSHSSLDQSLEPEASSTINTKHTEDLKYAQHEIERIQTYGGDRFQGSYSYSSSSSTHSSAEDGVFSDVEFSTIHDDSATESEDESVIEIKNDSDSVIEVSTSPANKYPLLSFDSQGSTLAASSRSSTSSICSTDKVQKGYYLHTGLPPVTATVTKVVSRSNFNINTRSLQDLVGKFKRQKDSKFSHVSKASSTQPLSVTQRFQRFLHIGVY
ncbi:hypothetical protein J3Q64DRAFT_1778558 [Phycomyces blakesleeanus]|uniref:Uncharacterized protein n=2 Tax=Phycomyces blakesleeanus TaxID=4837 RepID=A0A167LC39_PHYB8|nr:hypothetical protein PHYBLDRAFT_71542 [Phycomyces blakesleeanus NRRL 1555(-)]OAD70105.1 hypothetical protein PHYBLDRAFT_71542 [Phycomyces blakesleeanus NRRL 1555(-)]|eukprot:XP_018288145.1 hypothetical protein PHYBLDRAFT_71542 [Phycomyces blakesleeanus NRRL 1555(-)]